MTCEQHGRNLAEWAVRGGRSAYLAPSILAADFARLGEQVSQAAEAGAEVLHIDIMDGHFVPNLSMGPAIVQSLRGGSPMLFDVHLMISRPAKYIETFAKAGADHITVHVESEGNMAELIEQIHSLGCTAGLTLRPGTPVESLFPYLPMVEMALVMTVEPGFGGQSYMASQLPKVVALKQWAAQHGHPLHIEVDGGIKANNAGQVTAAGADILVAGSSVFNPKTPVKEAVAALQTAIAAAPLNS